MNAQLLFDLLDAILYEESAIIQGKDDSIGSFFTQVELPEKKPMNIYI